jgi:putative cardiolipin synthase
MKLFLTDKLFWGFVLIVVFTGGCAQLPPRPDLPLEQSLAPAENGPLADLARDFSSRQTGEMSGFHLLIDAREAFEARLAMIDSATRSIDLQYFIWKGDDTGLLLFDRLLQAADRGVRVRAIVDDIWLGSSTRNLIALNAHPNLEIRVFNPNPSRDYVVGGMLHYLASFRALNRRMHNKLMIADNHAFIVGGRNLGNEYFGLGTKFNFVDVDVFAIGAVVGESSRAFDDYWNDNAVYPVSGWKHAVPDNTLEEMRLEVVRLRSSNQSRLQSYPLERKEWGEWIKSMGERLRVGEAHFLQDDPVQINGREVRLADMIDYLAEPTENEILLSSPYLIPVDKSLETLKLSSEKGVRVRLLTNSLASTNHTLVNSHYKKYRRSILDTGTQLYEFRYQPSAQVRALAEVVPVRAPFISLHAKTMVSDRRFCFIGSLNFDPRALVINSENGVLIDSPELAGELAAFLERITEPQNSWQLTLGEGNRIQWQSSDRTIDAQPARGFWQSFTDFVGRLLPIENQL